MKNMERFKHEIAIMKMMDLLRAVRVLGAEGTVGLRMAAI